MIRADRSGHRDDTAQSDAPFFSIVIPTFDRATVVGRAIASVLDQTYRHFELLIADDGSTDDTHLRVEAVHDPRVRYLWQPNRGVSAARNLGLSRARGEVVTFLDSDGRAEPDWLAVFAGLFADPQTGLATAGARLIESTGGSPIEVRLRQPRDLGPLYCNRPLLYAPPGTLAARRRLLMEIGGYAATLRFSENSELAMRLVPHCIATGFEVAADDRPLVTYHLDPAAWQGNPDRFASMRHGAEYILKHHGRRLRDIDPGAYANYRGVAAVNAARLGNLAAARRHLAAALRARPLRWKNYLRWILALVPSLAMHYWRRHVDTDPEPV